MAQEYTTLSVTPDTRDRVKSLKRGGESYDDVLGRLTEDFDGQGNA